MSLEFVEQSACLRETIISDRTGSSTDIHYVVKKTPFSVVLRVKNNLSFDFKSGQLRCELLYDVDSKDSDVTSRSVACPDGSSAVEFSAHASADGKECKVDLRLFMLTTQANGIHFVVRFTLSPKTPALAPVFAESAPIVVVSKQQQIRNKEAELQKQKDPENARSKKRVRTEDVCTVLEEIMGLQRETLALLGGGAAAPQLRKSRTAPTTKPDAAPATELSIEEAMEALVRAYRREALVSGLQRPEKIRRVLASQDVSTLRELQEIGFALTLSEISPSELNPNADRSSSLPPSDDLSFNDQMALDDADFEHRWPLDAYDASA